MAQKSDVTRSSVKATVTTTTAVTSEVVQPAPTPPQRFTLVLKMGWQQMKEFYKGFRNNDLLEALKSEWKAITKKLKGGKDINAREIEIINRSTKEKLQERFSEFQRALCDSLELKESDDLSHQNRSPLKSVRPDRFWQKNMPKLVPPDHFCCQNWSGRTNFGCQNQSPLAKISPPGDRFWQKSICQNRSPTKWHSYSCACMAAWI